MKILKWLHIQNIYNASAIPFLSQGSNFFPVFSITPIRKNIKCKVQFFIVFQNRNNRNSHNVNKLIIDIITNMATRLRSLLNDFIYIISIIQDISFFTIGTVTAANTEFFSRNYSCFKYLWRMCVYFRYFFK